MLEQKRLFYDIGSSQWLGSAESLILFPYSPNSVSHSGGHGLALVVSYQRCNQGERRSPNIFGRKRRWS